MTHERKTDSITFALPENRAKGKTAKEAEEILHKDISGRILETKLPALSNLHLEPTKFIGEKVLITVAWKRDGNNIKAFRVAEEVSKAFLVMVDNDCLQEVSRNYGGVKIASGSDVVRQK